MGDVGPRAVRRTATTLSGCTGGQVHRERPQPPRRSRADHLTRMRLPRRPRRCSSRSCSGSPSSGAACGEPPTPAARRRRRSAPRPSGAARARSRSWARARELSVDQIVDWWNAQARPTYRAVGADRRARDHLHRGGPGRRRARRHRVRAGDHRDRLVLVRRPRPARRRTTSRASARPTAPPSYAVVPRRCGSVCARRSSTSARTPTRPRRACTVPPLHNACVDPRFHLVSPKGKAPTWNNVRQRHLGHRPDLRRQGRSASTRRC